MMASNDLGRFPKPDTMCDSDMAAYARNEKNKNAALIEVPIAVMKKWRAEGT